MRINIVASITAFLLMAGVLTNSCCANDTSALKPINIKGIFLSKVEAKGLEFYDNGLEFYDDGAGLQTAQHKYVLYFSSAVPSYAPIITIAGKQGDQTFTTSKGSKYVPWAVEVGIPEESVKGGAPYTISYPNITEIIKQLAELEKSGKLQQQYLAYNLPEIKVDLISKDGSSYLNISNVSSDKVKVVSIEKTYDEDEMSDRMENSDVESNAGAVDLNFLESEDSKSLVAKGCQVPLIIHDEYVGAAGQELFKVVYEVENKVSNASVNREVTIHINWDRDSDSYSEGFISTPVVDRQDPVVSPVVIQPEPAVPVVVKSDPVAPPPVVAQPEAAALEVVLSDSGYMNGNRLVLKLPEGSDRSFEFQVTNRSAQDKTLKIFGFEQPIYRDNGVANNCGNILSAGKSCNVKFVASSQVSMKTTQAIGFSLGDAEGDDSVRAETKAFDVDVNVEQKAYKLRIIPLDADGNVGSVYHAFRLSEANGMFIGNVSSKIYGNVTVSDKTQAQESVAGAVQVLKYKFKNVSGKALKIKKAAILGNVSAFRIGNVPSELAAGAEAMVEITCDPTQGANAIEMAGNISRQLEVVFQQQLEGSKYGKQEAVLAKILVNAL